MSRIRRTLLLTACLLLCAGCVSTQKRFEKAQDLENQGRYAEAAAYYVKVLEKEPDWPEARERLRQTGARAVEAYLAQADAAQAEGRYDDALRTLERLDDLREEADDVGVTLAVPDDYAAYRDDLRRSAVEALLRRGEEAEARGDWSKALDAYQRARHYAAAPERLADITRRQAGVYLRWGRQDADREHYRAAFARAQQALDLLGPDHLLAAPALALQEDALEAGTRFVAFLPFWRTEAVAREAPASVVQDLNDVLLYDHWSAPVPFVAAADAVALRRELRRLRYDRAIVTRNQAAEIGRAVEADLVVVGEWTAFERREKDVKEKTRKARLKGRAATVGGRKDTTYVEQSLRLELRAEVAYRIIDPRTRRVLDEGSVNARASGGLRRAVYAGDYRDLDLSGAERSLFEDEERLATEDMTNKLVDDLAARLAERVYDRLLGLIP